MKLFSTRSMLAVFVSALIPFLLTDAGNPSPKQHMDKSYSSAASSVVAEKKLLSFSNNKVAVTESDDIKRLTAGIEAREYDIYFDAARQQYQSPNRKHNIRSYYKPGQWRLQSRIQQDGQPWQLTLVTEGIYADGQRIATPGAASKKEAHKNQLDFVYDGFTEQYINNTEGIRQNFIVTKAPSQTKTITVRLKYDGMQASEKANNVITFHKANTTLSYTDIKAWDAAGKSIAATMQLNKSDHSINLIASVNDAMFPVTIDPIIGNGNVPDIILEGNQLNASYGFAMSGAGDVNGDGYTELLVSAPYYDNGETDEGVVFLYNGSSTGINSSPVILEANQAGAMFGSSVSGAGDINGDGYSDVIIGASLYDNGQMDEGAAFVYMGSATGIIVTPSATVESNQANAQLGASTSRAGDMNADGFSDVMIGAPFYDNGQSDEGVVFVHMGSAAGTVTSAAAMLESNQVNARLGWSVSAIADVNGDGFGDIASGAPLYDNGQTDEGAAFVYTGSAAGINTASLIILESNQVNAQFGTSISGMGDVNGDGFSDVVIGAPLYDDGETDEGAAFVYYGSVAGITMPAAVELQADQANAQFGISVSGTGDVNGDGYSDVIIGAPYYDKDETDEGAGFIYYGSAGGINTTPVAVFESNQVDAHFGLWVSGTGDVNGDGFSDVIASAPTYDEGEQNEGVVFVYHGTASDPSVDAALTLESSQAGDGFGTTMASAGDINGDGYGDVIIAAPAYDNGAISTGAVFVYYGSINGLSNTPGDIILGNQSGAGFAVDISSAGDINGDGYSDVIVGASQFIYNQPDDYIAAAFIYYGSATGINQIKIDTIKSNTPAYDSPYVDNFGDAVSSAGDVNGDGYADVAIGASNGGGTGHGYASLTYGSSEGISHLAGSLGSGCKSAYGSSVSPAGDVNGDGFGDVIVGEPLKGSCGEWYTGAVHIFYGSSTGISVLNQTEIGGENGVNEHLGFYVSAAGDINGDGFSDIITSTRILNNDNSALIYYGSQNGIDANAVSMMFTGALTVSGGGDINGDGYGDVISGNSLYTGSPTGINVNPIREDIAGTFAGDVNGDGFSDIISNNAGTVTLYYGNNGGAKRNMQLYNPSSTIPISQSNMSQSNFAVGVYAKNPQGRTKGKLVWETRSQGQPFSSGSPITNSTQFTAQQAAFTDLGTAGIQLTDNISKTGFQTKVRARIKYDAATSLNGQVYSPWLYPQGLFGAMGMNAAALPVELLDFTAVVVENQKVKLDWQTASETNNAWFTVERSIDAQQWEVVTKVKGAGSSSVTKSYQVFDDHPYAGISYYRLKQTDSDGKFVYSEMRKVNITMQQISVRMYPNPATNTITIEGSKKELEAIVLFNGTGQNVTGAVHVRMIADTKVIIDISKVASGIYYIKTTTTTGKIFKR